MWVKILGSVKSLPRVKNNETITKFLKKSRFWLCNRNETVYTNYITGSKEASEARPEARFDRFDSLFIGDCRRCTSNSYFYRRMCGAGAFVVGLHSVPYLFNSNFYQLTLRASNGRVLFFFTLISAPQERCTSRGRVGGGSVNTCAVYLPCVAVGCSCTVWFVLCGGAVCPRYCCAVSRQKCYPQGLSTVWRTYSTVIHMSAYPGISRQKGV